MERNESRLPVRSLRAVGAAAGVLLLAAAAVGALPATVKRPRADGILAFGLRHIPLGNARLTAERNGNLRVSRLGASGEDGVAVELGGAQGWDADWLALDPAGTVPDGASLSLTFLGRVDGAPRQEVAVLSVEDIGETLEMSVDFSALGAGTTVIEVRDGGPEGRVVAHVEGGNGPVAQRIQFPFYGHIGPLPGGGIAIDFGWRGFKNKISITGGPTVEGDYLCIMPADATARVGALSRVELRTSGIPELTLIGESLTVFGLRHRAAGDTALEARPGRLSLVAGTSGDAAVEVDVHGRAGWDAAWTGSSPRIWPTGPPCARWRTARSTASRGCRSAALCSKSGGTRRRSSPASRRSARRRCASIS